MAVGAGRTTGISVISETIGAVEDPALGGRVDEIPGDEREDGTIVIRVAEGVEDGVFVSGSFAWVDVREDKGVDDSIAGLGDGVLLGRELGVSLSASVVVLAKVGSDIWDRELVTSISELAAGLDNGVLEGVSEPFGVVAGA